jgi:hypothetical protein
VRPTVAVTAPRENTVHFVEDAGWPSWFAQLVAALREAADTEGVPV